MNEDKCIKNDLTWKDAMIYRKNYKRRIVK
jgi:hypothetical protein